MRIFPVKCYTQNQNQQKAFKGQTKYLDVSHGMYNSTVNVIDYKPQYPSGNWEHYFKNNDCSELLKNRPYASVEKTLGEYHSFPSREIYYADPKEEISTALKDKMDYIIYDNEPPYPLAEGEVSENYFGTERVDYAKQYAEIRDYYYRLEMADTKTAEEYRRKILADVDVNDSKEKYEYYKKRIEVSKYQQAQAQKCIDIYNEGGDLRYKKETAEDKISRIKSEISSLQYEVDRKKTALKNYQALLKTKEAESQLIDSSLAAYTKLKTLRDRRKDMEAKEYNFIGEYLCDTQAKASFLDDYKQKLRESIQETKLFIASAPSKIKNMRKDIKTTQAFIEKVKAELIPHFDKLKNYYNVQQIIRR